MDELISKKDLLAATGISYGQLYRWKREGLIPEEWFNKQSSITGQETFFPREEILARVTSILSMKDSHSLEELAEILASEDDRRVPAESVRALGPAGVLSAEALEAAGIGKGGYRLGAVAFAFGLAEQAERGCLSAVEARSLAVRALPALADAGFSGMTCSIFRVGDEPHVCLTKSTDRPEFDPDVTVIARVPLGETLNAIKTKL